MKWTNNYSLPEPVVKAITNHHHRVSGDISVTQVIKPPRQRVLEVRHDSEIVQDVSEGLWALLGRAVHHVLSATEIANALQEEPLKMNIGGWVISGTPDLYEDPNTLTDYKVTSVYSFLLGDKPEWEKQLQYYRLLYQEAGFRADKMYIHAILRDHQKSKALQDSDYPVIPFMTVEIPARDAGEVYKELHRRVVLHREATDEADEGLPECSPEERWAKPDRWAVKKKGSKRAINGGVCESEEAAIGVVESQAKPDQYEIEFRQGGSIKCEGYCLAAPFCNQYRAIQKAVEEAA